MSKCAVHMMKMKMSAMGGIQSHNQREHESRKNKEIDYDKSEHNFDTVLDEDINYPKAVKNRIAELNLKKAVRKDAVVYCSFIVSSDRGFFERLAQAHLDKVGSKYQGWRIEDYKLACPEKYEELMEKGCREFFERATEFFKDRYGAENVINGTVHLDEATPHMHLGIVPVTSDGRLSAKELFTPSKLAELQTDFASEVGQQFRLERGKEGSEATHLDELSFKVQKREENLQNLENDVFNARKETSRLKTECELLQERSKTLKNDLEGLKAKKSTLEDEIRVLEGKMDELDVSEKGLIARFLEQPAIKKAFEVFCEKVKGLVEQRKQERSKRDEGQNMSQWKQSIDRPNSSSKPTGLAKQNEASAEAENENDNILD